MRWKERKKKCFLFSSIPTLFNLFCLAMLKHCYCHASKAPRVEWNRMNGAEMREIGVGQRKKEGRSERVERGREKGKEGEGE